MGRLKPLTHKEITVLIRYYPYTGLRSYDKVKRKFSIFRDAPGKRLANNGEGLFVSYPFQAGEKWFTGHIFDIRAKGIVIKSEKPFDSFKACLSLCKIESKQQGYTIQQMTVIADAFLHPENYAFP